jgi:hypothetical protein
VTIINREQGVDYRGLWFSNTYGWADPEADPELETEDLPRKGPQKKLWQ